ncbi:MAG: nuclear transport factor 2 family protein, partial [Aquihabitans sp.]
DFEGIGALFIEASLAAGEGEPFARGPDEIAAFFARGTQLHDGALGTKHLVTNIVLDEPGADGVVVARSSYLVLQAVEGLPLQPIITGRYVDRFAKGGGGWYFTERRFFVDLVGDLSHHLADPSIAGPDATS